MSATAERVREIGFPWFDRHAVRGGKEIFAFTHDRRGHRCDVVRGCEWRDTAALLAFYRTSGPSARLRDGFVDGHDFATWEEAEAWLFAPSGGDA